MRVAVVGGGPAGLFVATLRKRARKRTDVRVFEQGPEGATWWFGVGLGGGAMREMGALDPSVHDDLVQNMLFRWTQNIHPERSGLRARIRRAARHDCLAGPHRGPDSPRRRNRSFDKYGRRVRSAPAFGDDDLVAADGISSALRDERAAAFGTESRLLSNRFAWYGVAAAMEPNGLVFRSTPAGSFCGHYYAYAPGMGTFVAECDGATWHRSGLADG